MENKIIKVLLLEDNPGDARLLKEYLSESETTRFDLTHIEELTDALLTVSRERFDVILSDLTVPDSAGFDTFLKLQSVAKDIPIIVLTGLNEDELASSALQQGAQDYLIKGQIDSASIQRSIRFSIERQKTREHGKPKHLKPGKKGRVLSFIGAKGGVGTTTVALNIALALTQEKKSVTAVELMSCYGTFSQLLGHSSNNNLGKLLKSDSITEDELAKHLFKHPTGLNILFSPQTVHEFHELQPSHVKDIIDHTRKTAEFVIVDFHGDLSSAHKTGILESDFVVLVIDNEPACVKSAKVVLDLLKSWNLSREHIGLVVVNRNRALIAQPMNLSDTKLQFDCEVIGVVPTAVLACTMAQKSGELIVQSHLDDNFVEKIIQIAKKLSHESTIAV